ncbi:hypothetical protein RM780_10105 [Streptomyces sp. DSM 44917]|uniref:Uncharacterized protein n=1 Tax=Streptomyces boetiae TaxID=3075541 RepID=A0ABU2L6W8_9ACTN|nr:hypothetical protein [Streptomyces sp. DSM 44917]MDT0307315.1 hypothetical protein [Streptomyces sp. DSM 44917]
MPVRLATLACSVSDRSLPAFLTKVARYFSCAGMAGSVFDSGPFPLPGAPLRGSTR